MGESHSLTTSPPFMEGSGEARLIRLYTIPHNPANVRGNFGTVMV